jgi:hypothetical protein
LVTKYFENSKSSIPTSLLTTSTTTISEGSKSDSSVAKDAIERPNHTYSPKKLAQSEKRLERQKEGSEADSDPSLSANPNVTNDGHNGTFIYSLAMNSL